MEKLLRLPEVMELTGVKKSTVWAWVKSGRLPAPFKLSSRVTVWRLTELQEWINAQGKVA